MTKPYAPVLKSIIEGGTRTVGGFFGFGRKTIAEEPIVDNGDPTFILFITDGENSDKAEADKIIRRSSEMNVFIQFIGIGNEQFKYLMALDDMPGRKRDNTGFSKMRDLDKADDNELYTKDRDFVSWGTRPFESKVPELRRVSSVSADCVPAAYRISGLN